jgi:hypothetical protein
MFAGAHYSKLGDELTKKTSEQTLINFLGVELAYRFSLYIN